jgi:hypothetical protein
LRVSRRAACPTIDHSEGNKRKGHTQVVKEEDQRKTPKFVESLTLSAAVAEIPRQPQRTRATGKIRRRARHREDDLWRRSDRLSESATDLQTHKDLQDHHRDRKAKERARNARGPLMPASVARECDMTRERRPGSRPGVEASCVSPLPLCLHRTLAAAQAKCKHSLPVLVNR